jgi:hypothetical protein
VGRLHFTPQNLFLTSIALCALIGMAIVLRLRRDVEEDDGSTSDEELFKGFERAYFAGEMDEAEFRRVTASLEAKKAKRLVVAEPEPPKILPEPPPDETS